MTFHYAGQSYQVFDAEIISNTYLLSRLDEYRQNEVVYVYDNTLVLRKGHGFVKLKAVQGDLDHIRPGLLLT